MQFDYFLNVLRTALSKARVIELTKTIAVEGFSIKDLIDLTFHKEEQVAFRASWILEQVYTHYPDKFLPWAGYFLEKFTLQQYPSCCRQFGKIAALMTSKKAPVQIKQIVNRPETGKLIEVIFGWLIDADMPVAVKAHCLTILANLSTGHSWIKEELLNTIDFLIDKESIAFYARAKQIKKQLI